MSRRKLIDQQIKDILTSTSLWESAGEEFDSDNDEDYHLPLNQETPNDSDQGLHISDKEASVGVSIANANHDEYLM